jgi:hypothetical protein
MRESRLIRRQPMPRRIDKQVLVNHSMHGKIVTPSVSEGYCTNPSLTHRVTKKYVTWLGGVFYLHLLSGHASRIFRNSPALVKNVFDTCLYVSNAHAANCFRHPTMQPENKFVVQNARLCYRCPEAHCLKHRWRYRCQPRRTRSLNCRRTPHRPSVRLSLSHGSRPIDS